MSQSANALPVLVITGPTAVGKTSASLLVAEALNAEIVSCDSMKVYKFMDIGTAKPTLEQRERVPHHLIDIVAPDEPYNVALFKCDAERVIREIRARGKLPIIVGGTALYLSALLEGYPLPLVPPDSSLRASLMREATERGAGKLHAKLREVDPEAAARIHPNDLMRIVRAIEVYETTGVPISQHWRRAPIDPSHRLRYNAVVVGLIGERNWVKCRIDKRALWMLRAGLLDEIKWLLEQGYSPDLKPMQALGYREYVPVVLGKKQLEEALEEFKRNSYRFERRQRTWFKKRKYIRWLDVTGLPVEDVAQRILRVWEERMNIDERKPS